MDIIKLNGVVKEYAWGNSDYIPSLIGGRDGKPKAELWMGTHSSGEARLDDGELLSSYLEKHPEAFGKKQLPLLFKVLAIQNPLSMQCHPDKKQAEEGWKRETALREKGLVHNYQDDNEKAEVIAAITPITAMCAFRSFDEIVRGLKEVIPESYDRNLSRFEDIRSLFFALYSLDSSDKAALIEEYRISVKNSQKPSWSGNFLTEHGIAERLLEFYPDDIGTLSPYMLNVVHLQIGEALYLKPGTLHAYVLGNGVELMSASDNVLRGGLTKKHMDLDELGRIMSFSGGRVEKVKSHQDSNGRRIYEVPSSSFALSSAQSGEYLIKESRFRIGIVIEGVVRFSDSGESITFNKGSIFMIGKDQSEYLMRVRGLVYFAEVPE